MNEDFASNFFLHLDVFNFFLSWFCTNLFPDSKCVLTSKKSHRVFQ